MDFAPRTPPVEREDEPKEEVVVMQKLEGAIDSEQMNN